jgi:hypothetical protein
MLRQKDATSVLKAKQVLDVTAILSGLKHRRHAIAFAACHEHPWFIDLLGGRPHLGPNALTMLETSLAALNMAPGFTDIDDSMGALGTINAYVIGAVRRESSDLKSGMNKAEWQKVWWPYLERVIATGRFPMLAKVVLDATHPCPDVVFDRGLETVLDGSAAHL